jgi:predicted nucleotidyltransferase
MSKIFIQSNTFCIHTMLERLLTSKTRVKILTFFLLNPDRELHLREIARLIDENINAVRRELINLEDIGLVTSKKVGNLKQYKTNKNMPVYEELQSIILKTEGVAKTLQEHLHELGSIQTAFIYGSFAQHTASLNSDIDVFIIGTINEKKLIQAINILEKQLSREINYVFFTPTEFTRRKKNKDPFVTNVLNEPITMLLGKPL